MLTTSQALQCFNTILECQAQIANLTTELSGMTPGPNAKEYLFTVSTLCSKITELNKQIDLQTGFLKLHNLSLPSEIIERS